MASSEQTDAPVFYTRTGLAFPAFSADAVRRMRRAVANDYGILPVQVAEAASYSMAMVVRYALGLSAAGGRVLAIADNNLSGAVALATLRHLVNAGALAHVLLLAETESDDIELQLKPLRKMEVPVMRLADAPLSSLLDSSHNVVLGVVGADTPDRQCPPAVVTALNEASTPVHTIEAPPGLDLDTGKPMGDIVFASSTLSLGAIPTGLHIGNDYAGRHYLCDVSIPPAIYAAEGFDLAPLFAEQPVMQVLTADPAAASSDE